jgi:hypothetical protein
VQAAPAPGSFCATLRAMPNTRRTRTWALVFVALSLGCAQERKEIGPEATLDAFARALRSGDTRAAYALMSEDYRDRVSFPDFDRRIRENGSEAKALADALGKRAEQTTHVDVRLADGTALTLERTSGGYAITTPVAEFYAQDSPRAALDSFIRAVERSRWDVLWSLMPEADREGLDAAKLGKNLEGQVEELTRIVALLKASRELPIEIVGERATMPYGESFTARFVQENGVWKVEDPE